LAKYLETRPPRPVWYRKSFYLIFRCVCKRRSPQISYIPWRCWIRRSQNSTCRMASF
jgi:hypothetical protein